MKNAQTPNSDVFIPIREFGLVSEAWWKISVLLLHTGTQPNPFPARKIGTSGIREARAPSVRMFIQSKSRASTPLCGCSGPSLCMFLQSHGIAISTRMTGDCVTDFTESCRKDGDHTTPELKITPNHCLTASKPSHYFPSSIFPRKSAGRCPNGKPERLSEENGFA